jgi:hypothetical protein
LTGKKFKVPVKGRKWRRTGEKAPIFIFLSPARFWLIFIFHCFKYLAGGPLPGVFTVKVPVFG